MEGDRLDREARNRALEAATVTADNGESNFDVLVIGGGVTGAGIALDAASRGLQTCIVEAGDWAVATSSRSSKLVHGGLRYLKTLNFKLIREALTERDLLLTKLAPHLVSPQRFIFPLKRFERPLIGAGVAMYELLGASRRDAKLPRHRHLSGRRLNEVFPGLDPSVFVGAITYYDATVDDARLVMSLVRTAVGSGAQALSRVKVTRLTTNPEGEVSGAVAIDLETGREFQIAAKNVIVATGVWTEETQDLAETRGGLSVLASKGVHIVVPRGAIDGEDAVVTQTKTSVLFLIPWGDYWMIGTTDTPWGLDRNNPLATASDIEYLLDQANAILARPISADQILGVFAGLRPLLQKGVKAGTSSSKVSREHTVASPLPGLTVIAGGKLTTYRVMAKDAVDHALGDQATSKPSVTHNVPVVGARGLNDVRRDLEIWQDRFGWREAVTAHLIARYGDKVRDIVTLCHNDRRYAEPLESAPGYLRAEIVYAVTNEGALHLDDVLSRRTHIAQEHPRRGVDAASEVLAIIAPLLDWDEDTAAAELAAYTTLAQAEEFARDLHDDRDATRLFAATMSKGHDQDGESMGDPLPWLAGGVAG